MGSRMENPNKPKCLTLKAVGLMKTVVDVDREFDNIEDFVPLDQTWQGDPAYQERPQGVRPRQEGYMDGYSRPGRDHAPDPGPGGSHPVRPRQDGYRDGYSRPVRAPLERWADSIPPGKPSGAPSGGAPSGGAPSRTGEVWDDLDL